MLPARYLGRHESLSSASAPHWLRQAAKLLNAGGPGADWMAAAKKIGTWLNRSGADTSEINRITQNNFILQDEFILQLGFFRNFVHVIVLPILSLIATL